MKKFIIIFVASAIALATLLIFNGWYIDIENVDDVIINQKEEFVPESQALLKGEYIFTEGIPLKTVVDKRVNTNKVGKDTIKHTASFLWINKTVSQTIDVKDITPPQIILTDNEDNITEFGEMYIEDGFIAIDDVDGDITNKVEIENMGNEILYYVTDNAGNIAEAVRKINYRDTTPPKIELVGSDKVILEKNEEYIEPGYTATDGKDGDITEKVQITGVVNTKKPGEYTIKYTIEDKAGNISEKIRVITVTGDTPKTIYLTFDDGPSAYTNELLDILKEHNVKATFFVVGTTRADALKRMYEEGHQIGAHSMTHTYSKIYANIDAYFDDLQKVIDVIYDATGYMTKIIRFPGGSSNTVSKSYCEGIMSQLVKEVEERGYYYFDWNVSSGDAGGTTTKEGVLNNIISGIKNKQNAIVLQHDTKKFSVDAVEELIVWAQENGYEFDVLTEGYPVCHHGINN